LPERRSLDIFRQESDQGASRVKLKYTLILVHGIAVKDEPEGSSSWGRIPEALRSIGVEVHLGGTDAWGSVEGNARILGSAIDRIVGRGGPPKVNIVAHSKGGIDSRYLISALGYSAKVASLTTIDTPHRGSEIADLVAGRRSLGRPLARRALARAGLPIGDRDPRPYEAALELTTASMARFNAANPDSPEVRYRSLYTRMRGPLDDLSLFLPYLYLRIKAGDNDGLVSNSSARRGGDCELVEGSPGIGGIGGGISHVEIAGSRRSEVSGVDIPSVYLRIAAGLAEAGL
jgi:triacylglycerol lipase